jgi:SPP1 gp7 family putative phage head morphogenesis protein
MPLARDRTAEELRAAKADWARARKAEVQYGSQLRKIARVVAEIIRGFSPDEDGFASQVSAALNRYAEMVEPWARSVAKRMMFEVASRTDKEWRKVSAEMGGIVRAQFSAPDEIGLRFRELLESQVGLIQSIPRDAAVRVHEQVAEGVIEGKRFTEIAKQIQADAGVSKSKATLIARTETGRVTSVLLQARAESVGSETYIWRTARDADVRPSHKVLEGKVFRWDDPPECDPGHYANPGCIWNCRCYAEPILKDV